MNTTLRAASPQLRWDLLSFAWLFCAQVVAADDFKDLSSELARSAGADLFAIDADDSVVHLSQASSGAWSGYEALGGAARDIATLTQDGRFEVFVVGSDAAIWHNVQRAGKKGWSGWESLGGEAKRVSVAKSRAGRVELFVIGSDDAVWRNPRSPKTGAFTGWESLGGFATQLTAAEADGGAFRVFVVGKQSAILHRSSSGGEWEDLGAVARDVAAVRLPNGGHEVFVVGDDGAVWHDRRERADRPWSGWESLGGSATRIAVSARKPGVSTVYALTSERSLASLSQRDAKTWGKWQAIKRAGAAKQPSAAALDTRFSGKATMSIPEFKVSESRDVNLGIRFGATRQDVQITDFPPIVTKRFKTPLGSSKSTVTLVGSSPGTYDRATGQITIPVKLAFDQSLDVPVVDEDASLEVELRTDADGGSPVDAAGNVTLAANGEFRGRGNVNPLNHKPCRIVIQGKLDPSPGR